MPLHTLTTYLTAIPLALQALIVAAIYGAIVRWRFTPPMLLDAALIGLVLWRPSIGLAAWVGMLLAVRHVPTLAGDVVLLFKLDTFDGWTAHALLFALPALKAYTARPQAAQSLPEMAPPPAPTLLPEQAMPMLLDEGLQALNSDPTAPHVGVIGPSRLGKTTFIGVVLSYRAGDLVITTPKGAQYDPWFGATVVRTAMDLARGVIDWSPIERAISGVHYEMLRRNTSSGTPGPLTLVIDELTTTIAQLPSIAQKVIDIITMGAGSGVRLVAIATDVNVKGWRMDGRRDVLDNLVFARVEDGRRWSVGRLDANWRMVAPRGLDTGQVHGLAARVSLGGRGWAGGSPAEDGLLGGLLGAGVPPAVGGLGTEQTQIKPQIQTQTTSEAEQRIERYVAWRIAGIQKEQGRAIRHADGAGIDDVEWAEAGKRIKAANKASESQQT